MAIPNGTKFLGIDKSVDTTEKKSKQLNDLNGYYEFPDDFYASSTMSFAGTMINFGSTQVSILGGDTADFGTIKSASDEHIGFVILSTPCKVVSAGWQWAASNTIDSAAGTNKTITFKISSALVNNNMMDVASWTDYLMTTSIDTNSSPYPGFVEDLSGLNIVLPAGSVVTITAITSAPFDIDRLQEANASITLQTL